MVLDFVYPRHSSNENSLVSSNWQLDLTNCTKANNKTLLQYAKKSRLLRKVYGWTRFAFPRIPMQALPRLLKHGLPTSAGVGHCCNPAIEQSWLLSPR